MSASSDDVPTALVPRDGWQDLVQRLARDVRRVALEHAKRSALIVSRPPEALRLRPPLRSLDWVEASFGGLADEAPTTRPLPGLHELPPRPSAARCGHALSRRGAARRRRRGHAADEASRRTPR